MSSKLLVACMAVLAGSAALAADDPTQFPELVNANIPGAPKLGKPQLIMGKTGPVQGEGMGWAAPAYWDWDGDGKKDLLIGEFASGYEHGHSVGSFIRVYKNTGTAEQPQFSDEFEYAHHPFQES